MMTTFGFLLFVSNLLVVKCQEANITVECENRQQSKATWQICKMTISTTDEYSSNKLKNEMWKYIQYEDISESCFNLKFITRPEIRLEVDKQTIEYSLTTVVRAANSQVVVNCTSTSYNVPYVQVETSKKWCTVVSVASNETCNIEQLNIYISFSLESPQATFNKIRTSEIEETEKCSENEMTGVKTKFSISLEQCSEINKIINGGSSELKQLIR